MPCIRPYTQTPLSGPRAETGAATGYDNTVVGVHPRPLTARRGRSARRRWLRQGHQRPTRDSHGAILAGKRDAEAKGYENSMAVISGITRDKRRHRKDSS